MIIGVNYECPKIKSVVRIWKVANPESPNDLNLYSFTLQVKSVNRKQKKASVMFIDDPMIHKKKG